MSWKSFTPDELQEIRQNPYVKSATNNMIRFTVAFKEKFWELYQDQGQPPSQIMHSMGFDTKVLGETRISGIAQHVKEQAESDHGFTDVRRSPAGADKTPVPPSRAIIHMQHELAYLKQEIIFIKKIILADREARRKCSSKPAPKSNTE
jgi:hypothetical protein